MAETDRKEPLIYSLQGFRLDIVSQSYFYATDDDLKDTNFDLNNCK